MGGQSIARGTLTKARIFLDQAEMIGTTNLETFGAYVEAAIVFARSVTLHLQKEYRRRSGFDLWYSIQQKALATEPVFTFFKESRNFVLKEGPVRFLRILGAVVADTVSISVSESVSVKVIRGKPWYWRHPRVLWRDIRREIQPIREWFRRRIQSAPRRSSQKSTRLVITEHIHFDDPEWTHLPALQLLRNYFDKLETIVSTAEESFGASNDLEEESSR